MSNGLALVFPGQGSQRVGMLASAAEQFPQIIDTFAEASAALDYDVWDMVQNGAQEDLNLTERTQPIILTASVALWRVWQHLNGPRPALMAGHSLGEFSALVCAGSLDFADAVRLVRNRGRYMQTAVPVGEGAMAAVMGLADDEINAACNDAAQDQVVEAVNFNSPGQVVIAGHVDAVRRASENCKERGAKRAVELPVSAPFHTSLMQPAGVKLAADIEQLTLKTPEIPVVHNVDAEVAADPAQIPGQLIRQISSPVQWVASINQMSQQGIGRVVECGPGKVLAGLCKRIDRGLEAYTTEAPAELEKALEAATA